MLHKIAAIAVEDNKLLMVRRVDSKWDLVEVKQGHWLTEERAITNLFQRIIGCPLRIKSKIGDIEIPERKPDQIFRLSLFEVVLLGTMFLRDETIVEWRYVSLDEIKRLDVMDHVISYVVPLCVKKGILGWQW